MSEWRQSQENSPNGKTQKQKNKLRRSITVFYIERTNKEDEKLKTQRYTRNSTGADSWRN